MSKKANAPGPSGHQHEASKATAKFRANNPVPEGAQVQHWTKVRSAAKTGMSTERMNRNLSPLQSRNDKPATTLLTSKDGSAGTRYTVHEGVDAKGELKAPTRGYGNEHKFADAHLIEAERARLERLNPAIDSRDLAEVAGASAKWKMVGDPGVVSKDLVEKIDLSKGERPGPVAASTPETKTETATEKTAAGAAAQAGSGSAPTARLVGFARGESGRAAALAAVAPLTPAPAVTVQPASPTTVGPGAGISKL